MQKINLKLSEKISNKKGPRKINLRKMSIFENLTEGENS